MHNPTDRITSPGLCYSSRGALAGTRNSSLGSPRRIDSTTHRTISERSYHGAKTKIKKERKKEKANIFDTGKWFGGVEPPISGLVTALP